MSIDGLIKGCQEAIQKKDVYDYLSTLNTAYLNKPLEETINYFVEFYQYNSSFVKKEVCLYNTLVWFTQRVVNYGRVDVNEDFY